MKARFRSNNIVEVRKGSAVLNSVEEVKAEVRRHYAAKFTNHFTPRPDLRNIAFERLSTEESACLEELFTEEEIKSVDILCREIVDVIQEFHMKGRLPKAYTSSFLALVPKREMPQSLEDYRPISLINGILKIISKVLAVRLRRWMGWMEAIVFTSSMSVLVNGSPTSKFQVIRGLRQGDPLSPFLFAIAAEGLAGLVREASSRGWYKGFRISNEVEYSLLQFADDTIMIGDGSTSNLWTLKAIFRGFEMVEIIGR
ncbi:uncharacterized protein LOC131662655 [Vicia villosa]|uniref:uncharacterized protein LOC131662655 n=1 Tax=Vicia villosa TaxID=3911 RepID=UPI00273B97B7|nr:uncharacterized protein LOC131662655 [Vicia villosa]